MLGNILRVPDDCESSESDYYGHAAFQVIPLGTKVARGVFCTKRKSPMRNGFSGSWLLSEEQVFLKASLDFSKRRDTGAETTKDGNNAPFVHHYTSTCLSSRSFKIYFPKYKKKGLSVMYVPANVGVVCLF